MDLIHDVGSFSFESETIERMREEFYRYQNEEVSLEGFLDTLQRFIPSTIKNFFKFSKSLNTTTFKFKYDKKLQDNVKKYIVTKSYLDLDDDFAYIPPYYSGTYLQYADLLFNISKYSKALEKNIDQYEHTLGIVLSSDNGKLTDFSKDIKLYNQWRSEREEYKKSLAALFTSKSTSDKVPYTQVIKRQEDWNIINETMTELEKNIMTINVVNIKKKIEVLSKHLSDIKTMVDNKTLDNGNKDLPRMIAIGALEIAEQIEFYSLLRYQLETLTKAIIDTVEHYKRK